MKSTAKYIVETRVCGTCANYRQHYVLNTEGRWQPLWYGHCHIPKPRRPEPDGTCPHWTGYEGERRDVGDTAPDGPDASP